MGWVLASTYRLTREALVSSIRGVLAVSNVEVEDRPTVMLALDWFEHGMDFADALHLVPTAGDVEFATFDRSLVSAAEKLGIARAIAV